MNATGSLSESEKSIRVLNRFGLGLMILGAFPGLFGIYFLFAAHQSRSWPETQGKLLDVKVNTKITRSQSSSSNTTTTELEYYVSLVYGYEVDGTPFTSSSYCNGSVGMA